MTGEGIEKFFPTACCPDSCLGVWATGLIQEAQTLELLAKDTYSVIPAKFPMPRLGA